MRYYNIPIFIPHVGCPYDCIFCDQKKISSTNIPTSKEIHTTINNYLNTIPEGSYIEIAFFGGSFTAINENIQHHYLNLLQEYLKNNSVKGIRISTRPDCITQENLNLLKEYGVKTIELGVQSLNDTVLKLSSRNYTSETVTKASNIIKENGFSLGIQLMIGLPGDTYNTSIETVEKTIEIAPDIVRIYPTLVIRGTSLETMYTNRIYVPLTLEEAIITCKEMLIRLQYHNIEVIRIGLQPSEELRSEGTIVAGPFHPSFGELVEQEIFKEQTIYLINNFIKKNNQLENLIIFANPRDFSKIIGNKKKNLVFLKKYFDIEEIIVKPNNKLKKGDIAISTNIENTPLVLSRKNFISNKIYQN